jgi:hypothetical protein
MGNRVRRELGPAAAMAVAIFAGLLVVDLIFAGHALWFDEIAFAVLIAVGYFGWRLVRARREP